MAGIDFFNRLQEHDVPAALTLIAMALTSPTVVVDFVQVRLNQEPMPGVVRWGLSDAGVPVFDIRRVRVNNDLLVRDNPLGRALARSLGGATCVLMRGHGMTVVGASIPEAVYRAMYTEMNARLQLQARLLDGPITFLSAAEGRIATASIAATVERPWLLWKTEALRSMSK